jgi:hypothetical protein
MSFGKTKKRETAINPKTSAAVNTRSFSDGAERAALVADNKNPLSVTLHFKKDEVLTKMTREYLIFKLYNIAYSDTKKYL